MFINSNKFNKLQKLLKLNKPLVIFDMETTGPSISTDKIFQLAYIKVWSDGKVKKEDMYFNPEMEISKISTEICGINNEDVKDKPKFKDRAQELWDIFSDCYYAGFNVMNFDLPILRREFVRVGMDFDYKNSQIIDSRVIFQFMMPRNLSSAYEYFCGKEFSDKKNAMIDTETSAEILLKQLEKYSEISELNFINKMHEMYSEDENLDNARKLYWKHGKAHFSFSKYKDKTLEQVAEEDPGFLEWILSENFTEEVKEIIREAIRKYKK